MNEQQMRSNPYFCSLPQMIQESILMSGVEFQNEDDIRIFVENLTTSAAGEQNAQG